MAQAQMRHTPLMQEDVAPYSHHVVSPSVPHSSITNLPIVFVMGGPGSGKGTQCALIKEQFGYTHLSTGDLLRDEVNSGSPRGAWLNSIMVKGDLVPLETVLNLLKEAILRESPHSKGFLIDGFPREVMQANEFEKQVGPCSMVIYFEVPFDIMTERLLQRGITSGRVDDNAATIQKRLQTFADQTIPVVRHYECVRKAHIVHFTFPQYYWELDKIVSPSGAWFWCNLLEACATWERLDLFAYVPVTHSSPNASAFFRYRLTVLSIKFFRMSPRS